MGASSFSRRLLLHPLMSLVLPLEQKTVTLKGSVPVVLVWPAGLRVGLRIKIGPLLCFEGWKGPVSFVLCLSWKASIVPV